MIKFLYKYIWKITNEKDRKYGFIDKDGNVVIGNLEN